MESFEYTGLWWIPGKIDKPVAGTLAFDTVNGGVLSLIGSFDHEAVSSDPIDYEIINGAANTKQLTLYQCFETNRKTEFPGISKSTYKVLVIFEGHNFSSSDELVFNEMSVEYQYLTDWLCRAHSSDDFARSEDNKIIGVNIIYRSPDPIVFSCESFDIEFLNSFFRKGDRSHDVGVVHKDYLRISPSQKIHFNEFKSKFLYHLQNFFSLAVSEPIYPIDVGFRSDTCLTDCGNGRTTKTNISVYYRTGSALNPSLRKHPVEMLFRYPIVKDSLNELLGNWFGKVEQLESLFDLYFAIVYSSDMYLQHRFVTAVQALEAYHRRVCKGFYMNQNDYEPICKILTDAIPQPLESSFRQSLSNRIKYGYEYSLRKRLKLLIVEHQSVTSDFISNVDFFVNAVCDTRNYLTHYTDELQLLAKSGEELYLITEQLIFLIKMVLLHELGLESSKILTCFKDDRAYRNLCRSLKGG